MLSKTSGYVNLEKQDILCCMFCRRNQQFFQNSFKRQNAKPGNTCRRDNHLTHMCHFGQSRINFLYANKMQIQSNDGKNVVNELKADVELDVDVVKLLQLA